MSLPTLAFHSQSQHIINQHINTKQPPTVNQEKKQKGNQQYEIDYNVYCNQKEIYKWRQKTHHPIRRVLSVQENIEKHTVILTCENVVYGLDKVRQMKIQEIIYSMSEMLLGYQQILLRLGFVCVQEKLIGLNQKGEILLWVNENPVRNSPGSIPLKTQKDIINKVLSILQPKSPQNSFFTQLKTIQQTFHKYLEFLMQFKMKNKLKIIPKISNINSGNKGGSLVNLKSQNNVVAHHNQRSPLITSTSTNFIPTVNYVGGQCKMVEGFNINNDVNVTNFNHQGQNPFIGINKLHSQSEHQLMFLPAPPQHQALQTRKNSQKTSIMYPNNEPTSSNMFCTFNNQTIQYQQNNNAPVQQLQQSVKSTSKINFSYSQKRNDISNTPRHSTFLRQYTSDRRLPLLHKIQSETNHIKQFTLLDEKKQVENKMMSKSTNNIKKKNSIESRKIVPSYTIIYNPVKDSLMLQNEVQLKKSALSQLSQKSFKSQQQQYETLIPLSSNKTSMTTNHRSGVSQSHQSIEGKSSSLGNTNNNNALIAGNNDSHKNSDRLGALRRANNMFASNSSHRVSYSMVKDSFVNENSSGVKNTQSILMNGSQYSMNISQHSMNANNQGGLVNNPHIKTTLTTSFFPQQSSIKNNLMNSSQQKYQHLNSNPNMYTFGGLILPTVQQKVQKVQVLNNDKEKQTKNAIIENKNKCDSQQLTTSTVPPPSSTLTINKNDNNHHLATHQKQATQQQAKNKFSTTSFQTIQELYKTMNRKSQKKSMIINGDEYHSQEQINYQIQLSPVKQQPLTPIKQSNVVYCQNNNDHVFSKNNHNYCYLSPVLDRGCHQNKQQQIQVLLSPRQNAQQQQEFDYNQWRGITGLLNSSNVYELKQSIHCGPQIRTPLNIKLQLLDKFGRQIGHSILPVTPHNGTLQHTPQSGYSNSCVRSICIDQQ